MNPMRSRIPSTESRIASSTNPADPSFWIPLKTDPITQSEAGIDLTLGASLASYVARNVLAGCEPVAQTTAESVRRKASDLIDLRKIFAAHGEENIPRDPALQRKAEFGPAGWRPVDGSTQESSTSASHVQ